MLITAQGTLLSGESIYPKCRDIYSGRFPPRGGEFLSKLTKNREEFEGGLEKRKGKGGKEEKRKDPVKYLYEA